MNKIIIIFAMLTLVACIGPGQRGASRIITVNETEITYRFQSCAPSFKWDGYKVEVEGLEFPNSKTKNPLKFTVGKIGYEQKAIRSIKESIVRFDSMIHATCVTLIRLKEEANILKYSKHRDKLFNSVVLYLATLEATKQQNSAEDEVAKANELLDKTTVNINKK